MEHIQLASPHFLWLLCLLLLPLVRRTRALPYAHVPLLLPAASSWRLRLRPLRSVIRVAIFAIMIMALTRPQFGQHLQQTAVPDGALIIVLDISNSMRAQDLQPDRLAVAKQLIEAVILERPLLPIGLVLIGEQAVIQTPPTRDHDLLLTQVAHVTFAEQMGLRDGTALGGGLAVAIGLLANSQATDRHILLLTDGVNTDKAVDPLTVAATAAQLTIQVQTVGLGQPGLAPFPQQGVNGTYLVEWESLLDEPLLQQIAAQTDGRYQRVADSANAQIVLPSITAVPTIRALPTTQPVELFPWLILLSIGLVCAELWLGQTLLFALPEGA